MLPRRLGTRFTLEAFFLVLLALGAGLAHLRPLYIVAVMAAAWLLVALAELTAARIERSPVSYLLPQPAADEEEEPQAVFGPRPEERTVVAPPERVPEPDEEPPLEESELEPIPEPEPEPIAEVEPEPEPEPSGLDRPAAWGEVAASVRAEEEAQPEPKPEPIAVPEPAAEPEPMAEVEPEPEPEPFGLDRRLAAWGEVAAPLRAGEEAQPEPEPEPIAEPEPTAELQPEPEPDPFALDRVADWGETPAVPSRADEETQPEPEPEPEPIAEPDPTADLEPEPEPQPFGLDRLADWGEAPAAPLEVEEEAQQELEPPIAEPEPATEPEPPQEPEPIAELEPEPEPEPFALDRPTDRGEAPVESPDEPLQSEEEARPERSRPRRLRSLLRRRDPQVEPVPTSPPRHVKLLPRRPAEEPSRASEEVAELFGADDESAPSEETRS